MCLGEGVGTGDGVKTSTGKFECSLIFFSIKAEMLTLPVLVVEGQQIYVLPAAMAVI